MAKPLPDTTLPRDDPHLTVGDLAGLLERWSFRPASERHPDQHHITYRGPHGGRIKILASLQGRADANKVAAAARLARVDVETFLSGPPQDDEDDDPAPPTGEPQTEPSGGATRPISTRTARTLPAGQRGDSVVAQVLVIHVRHDRPMRLGEVVELCGGRVTRQQVSEASAHLCRTGHLDRIRKGVYQWAAGQRAMTDALAATALPATALPPSSTPTEAPPVAAAPATTAAVDPVNKLFECLFPNGLLMTPELVRDVQRWTELTENLAAYAATGR